MRKDLTSSAIAVLALTLLFGVAYPLLATGVAQVLFPSKADGSRIERNGRTVGSRLIGQDFGGGRRWFKSRPSATGYNPAATGFSNLAPNNRELSNAFREQLAAYLERERAYSPGLTRRDVPVDAVATSASGVDPHISEVNARIQARRVAEVRGLSLERVLDLVAEHTDGRFAGLFGEPGVNVVELNLALEEEVR